jgi:hypothetical protein
MLPACMVHADTCVARWCDEYIVVYGSVVMCLSSDLRVTLVQLSQGAALVLLYDLLLGQGVRPHGSTERRFLAHEHSFRQAAATLLTASSVSSLAELVDQQGGPGREHRARRHARVNLLLATRDEVVALLAQPPQTWPSKHQQPLVAHCDEHLPDVLSVPSSRDLHDHPLVAAGSLVLQSKASSMPAHALQAQRGWHVVDCCAAPGNKTSHVAAFVGAGGKVSAFERDSARCNTCRGAESGAGSKCPACSTVAVPRHGTPGRMLGQTCLDAVRAQSGRHAGHACQP